MRMENVSMNQADLNENCSHFLEWYITYLPKPFHIWTFYSTDARLDMYLEVPIANIYVHQNTSYKHKTFCLCGMHGNYEIHICPCKPINYITVQPKMTTANFNKC